MLGDELEDCRKSTRSAKKKKKAYILRDVIYELLFQVELNYDGNAYM